jgi:hypothetical protein
MRFCKSVTYPVYRPSAEHTFAELDFDSHAVYKKIVPHMRISERHFELPIIETCRENFREFLCRRNFPVLPQWMALIVNVLYGCMDLLHSSTSLQLSLCVNVYACVCVCVHLCLSQQVDR